MLAQTTDFLIRTVGLVLISSAYFWQFNSLKGPNHNSHFEMCPNYAYAHCVSTSYRTLRYRQSQC
jgi:hypothetical protein